MSPNFYEPTLVFGVVGGIGSGKSFVADEFVALGASRFDADFEAKALLRDPEVVAKLRARWPRVVDELGRVDSRAVADIVFGLTESAREELDFLNATIRPPLFRVYQRWMKTQKTAKKSLLVVDAPLLFEAGWETSVDFVVFVDASEQTRSRRVRDRGWSDDELRKRESRQLPLDLKKTRADFIVSADRDDSRAAEQVAEIVKKAQSAEFSKRGGSDSN
ncbi:MAG: dephospho-CoA kinase [Thermoguttaceae bacterium]|nr:dephospho-CoA kinase [Thermoguttaceae bacterium]